MANELIIKNGLIINGETDFSGLIKKTGAPVITASTNPDITNLSVLKVSGSGVNDTPTLSNGVDGQRLTMYLLTLNGSGRVTWTPTTSTGWSTFIMTTNGDILDLIYDNTLGWLVTGQRGGVLS